MQVEQSSKNASRTHSAQGDIDDRWKPSGEADVCKLSSHRKMRPGRTMHKEPQMAGGGPKVAVCASRAVTKKCVQDAQCTRRDN